MSKNQNLANWDTEQIDQIADELSKKIIKGGGIVFAGRIGRRGFGFILNLLLANFLGAMGFGLYSLGLQITNLANIFSRIGLHKGVVRYISLYKGEEDLKQVKGTLLGAFGISLIVSLIVSTALFAFSDLIATEIFSKPNLTRVIRLFSFGLPFFVFTTLCSFAAQGFQSFKYNVLLRDLIRPITNLILVLLVFLLGFKLLGAVISFNISLIITAVIGFFLLIRIFPQLLTDLKPLFDIPGLLRYSIPLCLVSLSFLFLTRADIYMLGYFVKANGVGIYTAAVKISVISAMVLQALNVAFEPVIANLYNQNQTKILKRLFQSVTRWVFMLTLPLTIILISYSQHLMGIFGSEFTQGWPILITLTLSQFANASVGPVGIMLEMTGRQNVVLINTLVCGAMNISLNILLIKNYGVIGAAIATGFTLVILNVLMLFEVYKFLGLHPYNSDFLKPLRIGIATMCLSLLLKLLGASWFINLVLILLLYSIGLFTYGITREDKVIIKAVRRRLKHE